MVKFLKKGKEGEALTAVAEAEQERRKNGSSVFRYWMPDNAEQRITFLDGPVSESGMLDVPRYWEHNLQINGSWKNWYPCTKDEEPCPLCDIKPPSLVYAFTIIDHRPWEDKKGKTHQHERKLYICKSETYKRLTKIAVKRDGLAGCTFDVSRIGEQAENVGNDFDFVEKLSRSELCQKYGLDMEGPTESNKVAAPYDYDEVIQYYTAEELRNMGLGTGSAPVGSSDYSRREGSSAPVKDNDFDKDL